VGEACGDEGAEIVGLDLGRDGLGESLPGVAGTLDDFDGGHKDREQGTGYRVQKDRV
jgi:hypothetical protein